TTTTTTITTTTTVDGATTTTTTTTTTTATTTVTLPATSTTAVTTTTTLASPVACVAGVPQACDDGDPCTLDGCVGGFCTHEALDGLAAVDCRLATLASLLVPGSAPRPLLRRLRARLAAARALVRATRALGAFIATAEGGMTHHRLERGFGGRLVDLAIAAASHLA